MNPSTAICGIPSEILELSELLPCRHALSCLDSESARRLHVLPLAIITENNAKVLLLACADDADVPHTERIVRHVNSDYVPRFIEYHRSQLLPAIAACYQTGRTLDELLMHARQYETGTSAVEELPVELVNALIIHAVEVRASDIHLSPESGGVQIRLRVDGVLINFASIAKALIASLLVRLKIMASLDIAETRYPQDGQFRRVIAGRNVDFRVSTFPTVEGENTVLRLIDAQVQRRSVSTMNLPRDIESRLASIMRKPEGLLVVCGPTGAGKSTTLFALLETIDQQSRSVMTLEDPVEHRIAGIRQTSIDASRQWGYSEGLRALLRQDPDVLLIGEIRDVESCSMVLRAVSTGHQVLTTVHASSAHAALHRLRELDATEGALALGLVAVIAQRLVRKICQRCRGRKPTCLLCHGTGYFGRQVIMELLEVNDDIRQLIGQGADIADIRKQSDSAGFVDLCTQAMLQVSAGHTTHDEVQRVLGDNKDFV